MTTATANPENATSGEVLELALDGCIPSPKNKERPIDEEFLTSLREKGQQIIALVRPHPTREGFYEIVDGARRQKGLWSLGHRIWRAEVREMSDSEADLFRAIANKHRTGLTWWQEAELIEEYLKAHGEHKTAEVGAALGMKNGQVIRRKQLLTLTPKWRKAINEQAMEGWGPECYELIAVYAPKVQDKFFATINRGWCPDGLEDLKRWLGGQSKLLKHAPWKLDDSTLCAKAGSCTGCSERSGANPDLFGEADEKKKPDDTCLNPGCWKEKSQAHLNRTLQEAKTKAKEKGEAEPVKISSEYSGDEKKKILGLAAYTACKKEDPGAKPAIYVDGEKVGAGAYIQTGKDQGKKKGQKSAKQESGDGGKSSLKERMDQKAKQRDALAIDKLITYIQKEASKTDFAPEAQALLTQYALARGLRIDIKGGNKEDAERIRAFAKKPFTAAELWEECQSEMISDLSNAKFSLHPGKPAEKDPIVQLIAWMVEGDFAELRKQAEEELPDPKSWANEKPEKKAKGAGKSKASAEDFAGDGDEGAFGDEEDGDQ